MDGGVGAPLRSLPRIFLSGIADPAPPRVELSAEELHKLRHVLRMRRGDALAVLPGDGRILRCRLEGTEAEVESSAWLDTEAPRRVALLLALSKPEATEAALRMATEAGAAGFVVFPSARSVVRWAPGQVEDRVERLRRIVREAAELSYRAVLPPVEWRAGLEAALEGHGEWWALSESETAGRAWPALGPRIALLVGPEGGWDPRESARLAGRSLSLGPRVLRVATAAAVGVAAAVAAG